MDTLEVIDISRDALYVLIYASAPLLLVALFVGLIISLFQALTQMQEATLSFVPKIFAIFFAMIIFLPYMFSMLRDFNEELMNRIITIS